MTAVGDSSRIERPEMRPSEVPWHIGEESLANSRFLTNINKIHSIHIRHMAKTFSFDDSQNNTFEEVYPFGKWVKGVSGMEVK